MGRMRRLQKRIEARPIKVRPWAGEPNARELELERKIEALDRKYLTVGLTEAERLEGVRLHLDLIEESQRRSGITLIKITRNAADTSATYDARNYRRVIKAVEGWMDAGLPYEKALARAMDDERWRQQQEARPDAGPGGGLLGRIKDIFRAA